MEQSWSYDDSKIEIYSQEERGGLRKGRTLFTIGAFTCALFWIHLPLGLLLEYVNLKVFILNYEMNFKYQNSYLNMTITCFELFGIGVGGVYSKIFVDQHNSSLHLEKIFDYSGWSLWFGGGVHLFYNLMSEE